MISDKCIFLLVAIVLVTVSAAPNYPSFDDSNIEVIPDDLLAVDHRVKRQSSISIGADHQPRAGTNINVDAQSRLWTGGNGRSTLDANANYNQHFGGPYGNGRPNYGAGLTFRHRF